MKELVTNRPEDSLLPSILKKQKLVFASFALLLPLLAGCGILPGHTPPRTGQNDNQVPQTPHVQKQNPNSTRSDSPSSGDTTKAAAYQKSSGRTASTSTPFTETVTKAKHPPLNSTHHQSESTLNNSASSKELGTSRRNPTSTTPSCTSKTVSSNQTRSSSTVNSTKSSSAKSGSQTPKETRAELEAAIVAPYESQLEQLKGQYIGQLNSLYQAAEADHRSGMNKIEVYKKYMSSAYSLENESQSRVNQVLFGLKDALQANNLPTTKVDDFRSQYYQAVKEETASMSQRVKN